MSTDLTQYYLSDLKNPTSKRLEHIRMEQAIEFMREQGLSDEDIENNTIDFQRAKTANAIVKDVRRGIYEESMLLERHRGKGFTDDELRIILREAVKLTVGELKLDIETELKTYFTANEESQSTIYELIDLEYDNLTELVKREGFSATTKGFRGTVKSIQELTSLVNSLKQSKLSALETLGLLEQAKTKKNENAASPIQELLLKDGATILTNAVEVRDLEDNVDKLLARNAVSGSTQFTGHGQAVGMAYFTGNDDSKEEETNDD